MRLADPGLFQLFAQPPVWTLPQFIEPVLSNASASSTRFVELSTSASHVDLHHIQRRAEARQLGDRKELRLHGGARLDPKAVGELRDLELTETEVAAADREGLHIVFDELLSLRLVVVAVLADKRQSGGVDGVREVRLVAGEARDIDRASHEHHQRYRGCREEDEDVPPLVAPQATQGVTTMLQHKVALARTSPPSERGSAEALVYERSKQALR